MTDRPNKPIHIPITFVESSTAAPQDDDLVEIDADAEDFSEGLGEEVAASSAPEPDADAAAATPEEAPAPEPADVSPEPNEVDAAEAVNDAPAAALPTEAPPAPHDSPAAAEPPPAAAPAKHGPELSVEAFAKLSQELRQSNESVERLTVEKNDLYDKLLRKQAEFENFRKRTEREMQETYRRARADILLDIIPALDNFELALLHADTSDATALREGVGLIHRQLTDILSRHGLEAVEALGKPFDPEVHEAVATESNDDVEENTVVQELQRGYKLGDRLLRPARVKVSVQS